MQSLSDTMLTERTLGIFSPLEVSPEKFKEAYELPIGEHVEKNYKGLSYLSWPFAFRYLKQHFPTFYVAFEELTVGWPVFGQENCWLLRPFLTDGTRRTPSLVFPLMDNRHNALKELNARAVSDNMQRASVKCIATFTGLGLKLYAGEDIPKADSQTETLSQPVEKQQKTATKKTQKKEETKSLEVPTTTDSTNSFDGKKELGSFCVADPFEYGDKNVSYAAGAKGLKSVGFEKAFELKSFGELAGVVLFMIGEWNKENGITVKQEEALKVGEKIKAAADTETLVKEVASYVKLKK